MMTPRKKRYCSTSSQFLVDLADQEFGLYWKLQLKYESASQGPRSEIRWPHAPCEVGRFIARLFSSICTASTRPPTFSACRPCGWVRCELMRVVKGQVCVEWLSATSHSQVEREGEEGETRCVTILGCGGGRFRKRLQWPNARALAVVPFLIYLPASFRFLSRKNKKPKKKG